MCACGHWQEAPDAEPRPFTFDYSYWSHDGGIEQEDGGWSCLCGRCLVHLYPSLHGAMLLVLARSAVG